MTPSPLATERAAADALAAAWILARDAPGLAAIRDEVEALVAVTQARQAAERARAGGVTVTPTTLEIAFALALPDEAAARLAQIDGPGWECWIGLDAPVPPEAPYRAARRHRPSPVAPWGRVTIRGEGRLVRGQSRGPIETRRSPDRHEPSARPHSPSGAPLTAPTRRSGVPVRPSPPPTPPAPPCPECGRERCAWCEWDLGGTPIPAAP